MTTPNTSISALGVGDINVELNYAANTARAFNDGIFRNLTGSQSRQIANSTINLSDLSAKTAFGGIISADSVVVTSYGVIERTITLTANTDMYSPDIVWQANLVSGANGTFTTNGKTASYTVRGTMEANVTSNVQITATLSYGGHQIGVASKYLSFELNSLPPNLTVTGNTSANSVMFEATNISTTLVSSANAPGSTVNFIVSPNDAGVFVSGNTVTFTATADQAGVDNNRSYSVTTQLLFNGQVIASDNKAVNVRAFYAVPDFSYSVPATTNNNFANTGTVYSSLTLTTEHFIPNANMVWSAVKVSGDDAVLTVAPDLVSANLHVNVASGVFQTKKSIYDVTATLKYSNGQVITSKTQRLTLRTGAYGLTFNPAANVAESGYNAQTAIATATATYAAGTFAWNVARVSGDSAVVANSSVLNNVTLTVNLSNDAVGTKNAVYRINPVLTFDGVVMANVASQVTLSAQQNAYTFSLSGATSNTQLGAAPVSASLATVAAHNIANGSIVWSKPVSDTALSANGLTATTTYTNNTIGSDTFALSATLKDDQGRNVQTINRTLTLRAYDPAISFAGANTVSKIGYTDQVATAFVNAAARAGANTLVVTAEKLQGADLVFSVITGTSALQQVSLTANKTTIGTDEGLYRLYATATWFGVTNTVSYDVSVGATKDDPQFTLNGNGESKNSFNFPVVANGSFTASHVINGGTITWSRTINSGTVTDTPVANATNYVFRTSRSSVGTATANVTVTATLRDSAGLFVDAKSVTVATSATVNNPSLVLNGPAANTVSNTFHADASITLTPSVAAGLVGHTFTFSAAAATGSATVTSNSSAIVLSNTFDGIGSASGAYDVTCNVVYNGQTIASTTRRVTVTATCPAPTINFASANDTEAGYNFPVTANATVDASSTPAGAVISWSWAAVSGAADGITTSLANSRLNVNVSQSNYGVKAATYDVTATYRTPNGTLLTTRTARVTSSAERKNPNLQWSYVNGVSTNNVTGFAENLSSSISLVASVDPALVGHSFRITPVFAGGNYNNPSITTSNAAGTATVTVTNNRTTNGTNQKTSQYDMYIDVVYNAQVITGQLVQRTYHTITPGVINGGNYNALASAWNTDTTAYVKFLANGTVETNQGTQQWMVPGSTAEAANYQIMFTNISSTGGASGSSAGNVWLEFADTPTRLCSAGWVPKTGEPRSNSSSCDYQIRRKSDLAIVASGSISLSAESGA